MFVCCTPALNNLSDEILCSVKVLHSLAFMFLLYYVIKKILFFFFTVISIYLHFLQFSDKKNK